MTHFRISTSARLLSTPALVHIKESIYDGQTQVQTAAEYGILQSDVSHIKAGRFAANIPWPDGSTGALSSEQIMFINAKNMARARKRPCPSQGNNI